ncbi:MAG: ABC transporter permease, partial [Thermoproteota archaeon]
YQPINKSAIVYISRNTPAYTTYPFSHIVTLTNEKGEFEIHGIGPSLIVGPYFVEAYVLDNKSGQIEYSPDFGQYGAMYLPFSYYVVSHPFNVTTIVFKSVSVVFTDVYDIKNMRKLSFYDPRFGSAYSIWSSSSYIFSVFDQNTLSEPVHWGQCFLPAESDFLVYFLQPGEKYYAKFQVGSPLVTLGFLANSSKLDLNGFGFQAPEKGQQVIMFTPLRYVKDMIETTKGRLSLLSKSFIKNPVAEVALSNAEQYYFDALDALEKKDYKTAYGNAIAALLWVSRSYSEVMNTMMDSAKVNAFFALLAIPFSIILEPLLFDSQSSRRKFIHISIIATLTFMTFYLLHPSAKLGPMWTFTPIGIALIMLFSLVLGLLLAEALNITRIIRYKLVGKHIMERGSTMSISFSYGVRNIRKRKFRSLLTMITITMTTFGLVSFSSLVNTINITIAEKPESTPSYKGILITRPISSTAPYRLDPIESSILYLLNTYKVKYKNITIAPRAWLYPESVSGKYVVSTVRSQTSSYSFSGILGLTKDETKIFNYSYLIEGSWFNESEGQCIISSKVAKSLNISVGDIITWAGIKLKVVGILNSGKLYELNLRDLNYYPITPVDPNLISSILMGSIRTENEAWSPLSWDSVLVIPFNLALSYGGFISSVAIQGNNLTEIDNIARALALTLSSVEVYVSDGYRVRIYSSFNFYAFQGLITLVPAVIGFFTVLNSVLASVKERQNEISVYSAVGTSPRDIGLIFLAEEVVYALVGAVIGYLSGMAVNSILISMNLLPPTYVLNSSSSYVLLALTGTVLATILASLYPLSLASKLVTPSLERKWKLTTKPIGDAWDVPFPFLFDTYEEAIGVLRYLTEFFMAHSVETTEIFITREVRHQENVLEVVVTLKPIDAGILQAVTFNISEEEGKYVLKVHIQRISGIREAWTSGNYQFIDAVRKQFLVWRGLHPQERNKYIYYKQ